MTPRAVPAVIATLLGVALASSGCATHAVGRKVDLGGYRLHLRCAGRGAPTVVFDAGLGDSGDAWSRVAPDVARFTRACVYDRAGLGRSDPGPQPRTSGRIVGELHALLARAGERAPFVLVGHSFGGLSARLYATRFPAEVAGLVLVEATHEDFPDAANRLRPASERLRLESTFAGASATAASEYAHLGESAAEMRAAAPLPDIPLVVISSRDWHADAAVQHAWSGFQDALARLAPRAEHVIVPDSGHYVQFEKPRVVVAAIARVVRAVRRTEAVAGGVSAPAEPPRPAPGRS